MIFLHLIWSKVIFVYSHNLSIVLGGDSLCDTAHMNRTLKKKGSSAVLQGFFTVVKVLYCTSYGSK